MKTSHTPGPWIDCPIYGDIRTNDGEQICEINSANEECIANGRLIAASPDLLKALRDTQGYLDAVFHMKPDRDRGAEFTRIREVIQDAIAKATQP